MDLIKKLKFSPNYVTQKILRRGLMHFMKKDALLSKENNFWYKF
jgi:hypothetical protein